MLDNSTVIWRPERLTARLITAAGEAARDMAKAAAVRAPSRQIASTTHAVGAGENYAVVTESPLGLLFEQGVRPHAIEAKKKAVKFADGGYAPVVQHPGMKAQPYLKPLLPLWTPTYRRQASQAFRGF